MIIDTINMEKREGKGRMRRRGYFTPLMHLLLFLVVAIVVLALVKNMIGIFQYGSDMKVCQASLNAQDFRVEKLCVSFMDSPADLRCARHWLTIGQSKSTISSFLPSTSIFLKNKIKEHPLKIYDPVNKEYVERYNKMTPEMLKSIFADQISYCWRQFFKGEKVVFLKQEISDLNIFKKSNNKRVCFVCSEIFITPEVINDIKSIDPIALKNFNLDDYLQTRVDPSSPGKGFTYFAGLNNKESICKGDYFEKGQELGGDCWLGFHTIRGFDSLMKSIEGEQRFATVFMREGLDVCPGTGEGESKEVQAKKRKDASVAFYTYVFPVSSNDDIKKLNDQCDILIT